MPTGMRSIDLRWSEARKRLALVVPELLQRAGDELSDREKQVLEKFAEGKSAEDIGREVKNPLNGKPISRARVNQILHRAIRRALAGRIEELVNKKKMNPEEAWFEAEAELLRERGKR